MEAMGRVEPQRGLGAAGSQMHFIIQNIEKTVLLSEHVNLLITEMEPETADQKMQDFEAQIDLAEREQ
ncbi:uncharacterized protein BDCG_08145 [Blastomyces dermatitidis ER-3]|uniref:Uncharacterized protein n=1 Tax=Ajellomyces dermatitidis (strain ER-3 / ATCC MYA-2586) TaxID=559297 RepID=A0ABP2EP30_AJEDR|nr:uncharacterized protein BDCG_08145 [Blastomyces dermatitidis ER-3]EEQ84876.2 hypothetical protein BDCG_08145 [Blastomyces dermatitidis ER-3]